MLSNIDELVDEGERIERMFHPSRFAEPYVYWFGVAFGLGFGIMVGLSIFGFGWFYLLITFLMMVGVCGGIEIVRCLTNYYITSEKLVVERGITDRDVESAHFSSITDVSIDKSLIGRFLDIGKVLVNTAGADRHEIVFDGVNDPEEVNSLISSYLDQEKTENPSQDERSESGHNKGGGGGERSRFSHHTTARTSKLSVTALQNEIGRIERKQHQLEERRRKDLIDEEDYRGVWYRLRGRIEELNDLLDRLEE